MPYSSAEGDSYPPPVPGTAAPFVGRLNGAASDDGEPDGRAALHRAPELGSPKCWALPNSVLRRCFGHFPSQSVAVSSAPPSAAPIVRMVIAVKRALLPGGIGTNDGMWLSNAPCYMTKKLGILR